IKTHSLITDIIYANLYPLLPEIEFGELPNFEKEEPSWFATYPEAFTHDDLEALYLQWYGNDYQYEPLEDKEYTEAAVSYITTENYSNNWKLANNHET